MNKNLRQIVANTIFDLYENDRRFTCRFVSGLGQQEMIFSDNCLNDGKVVINIVKWIQKCEIVRYLIVDRDEVFEIEVTTK